MKTTRIQNIIGVALVCALAFATTAQAQTVEARSAKLGLNLGMPTKNTVEKLYDEMDFQRGVQAFLAALPGASLYALTERFRSAGAKDNQTVYNARVLDLKGGPLVIDTPPHILGIINGSWFNEVADLRKMPRQP